MRSHSMTPRIRALAFVPILLWAMPALAHKVTVFAWVEGNIICTESRFSAGKMVQNGKIEVYGDQGDKLLEGTTDNAGRFDFPVPAKSDLKVVLIAGMGHSNHWIVKAQELMGATSVDTQPVTHPPSENTPQSADTFVPGACIDADTVKKIVTQALEQKIAPLEAQLVGRNATLREIIAGIGYILGLVGLATYMQYRRKMKFEHHSRTDT